MHASESPVTKAALIMAKQLDRSYPFLAAQYVRRQVKQLVEQFDGVRAAEDIEFIHRARVASRRLRAALKMFSDCFDAKALKRWQKQIRRITEGLGDARDKDVQIANLGSRLNAALAQKVEELQRYRSDFFGRLREVLANRPGIQVVGDRFVFQSEVLFPVGSAELTNAGADEIDKLAETLKQISVEIPADIPWILRVDGHADRQRMSDNGRWGSNWELSAGRAITVVKLLAATGFGENQPLDPANTPEAYAKNRRIELRLTDR